MIIRALEHTELEVAEDIQCLFQDSYQAEARLLGLEDFPPLRRTVSQIQGADSLFLGCWSRERLVALAELERESDRAMNIAGFVVLPDMFRKGVGTALLTHIFTRFAECSITVATARANVPAVALYTKHGFEVHERWRTPDGLPMVTFRTLCP